MRVLCIARHRFISEHLERVFVAVGVEAGRAVGLAAGAEAAARTGVDAVVCEYELLATLPLGPWERDPRLGRLPVLAVSLSRRAGDPDLLDVNGIAGVIYLPTARPEELRRALSAACGGVAAPAHVSSLAWPGQQRDVRPTPA